MAKCVMIENINVIFSEYKPYIRQDVSLLEVDIGKICLSIDYSIDFSPDYSSDKKLGLKSSQLIGF